MLTFCIFLSSDQRNLNMSHVTSEIVFVYACVMVCFDNVLPRLSVLISLSHPRHNLKFRVNRWISVLLSSWAWKVSVWGERVEGGGLPSHFPAEFLQVFCCKNYSAWSWWAQDSCSSSRSFYSAKTGFGALHHWHCCRFRRYISILSLQPAAIMISVIYDQPTKDISAWQSQSF
jgi:hypothetical protein